MVIFLLVSVVVYLGKKVARASRRTKEEEDEVTKKVDRSYRQLLAQADETPPQRPAPQRPPQPVLDLLSPAVIFADVSPPPTLPEMKEAIIHADVIPPQFAEPLQTEQQQYKTISPETLAKFANEPEEELDADNPFFELSPVGGVQEILDREDEMQETYV